MQIHDENNSTIIKIENGVERDTTGQQVCGSSPSDHSGAQYNIYKYGEYLFRYGKIPLTNNKFIDVPLSRDNTLKIKKKNE